MNVDKQELRAQQDSRERKAGIHLAQVWDFLEDEFGTDLVEEEFGWTRKRPYEIHNRWAAKIKASAHHRTWVPDYYTWILDGLAQEHLFERLVKAENRAQAEEQGRALLESLDEATALELRMAWSADSEFVPGKHENPTTKTFLAWLAAEQSV